MRKLLTLIIASGLFVLTACPKGEETAPPAKEQVAKPEAKKVEKPLPEPKTAEEKQAAGEFTKENVAEKAKAFEAELDKDTEAARALGADQAK